jgi:hypothetical protein
MRRIFQILFAGTVIVALASAQISITENRLTSAQYWFDTVTPTNAVTVSTLSYDADSLYASVNIPNVDVSLLSVGRHILYLRFRDANGRWGEATTTHFYVNNPPPMNRVVKGQYWFDALTPNAGAVLVDTTTSEASDLIFFQNLTADISALSVGSHTLYFRMQDKNGKWGVPMTSFFRKTGPVVQKRIAKGEYWFNSVTRPASGVTEITTTLRSTDSTIADVENLSITLPVSLSNGRHTLYVRFQDSNGLWGPHVAQQFVIDQSSAPPLITQMEYFFGTTDPGAGNATAPRGGTFSLTNGGRGAAYADSFSIQTLGLPLGQTKVTARFKSDKNEWGPVSSAFFSVLTRPIITSSVIDSLRFGNLYSGRDSVTKLFYVRNSGDADLKVKVASKPSTQWKVKMYAPNDTVAKDSIVILKDSFATDSALVAVTYRPVKAGIIKNAIQFATNDSAKPVYTLPVAATADSAIGKLSFSADTLKFGQKTVGTATYLSVTIWNTGADTITVATGGNMSSHYTLFLPAKVKLAPYNPNDTIKLTVRFAPTIQGTFNTSYFFVNVYNRSTQIIESKYFYITGSSIVNPNPTINPSLTELNFGAISARAADNKDTSLTLLLGNIGTQTLSIKSITSSDTAVFKPTVNVTLPSNVVFNGSLQVTMKFKPTPNLFKMFTGNLTIRSTSLNKDSVLVIPMSGEGTNGPPLNSLALSDTVIDYGSVTVGFNAVKNITISNKGAGVNKTLTVTGFSANSGLFTSTQSLPFQIGPDSSKTIGVKFAPTTTGPVSGILTIVTDAPSRPTRNVELKGNGVITPQPLFETSMSPIAFSPTKVATPNTMYFKFKNTGNDTLRADSIFMVKRTSFFTVNRTNLKLGPNKTDSLLITFTPLAVANYTDSLIMVTNLYEPRLGIFATGSGAQSSRSISIPTSHGSIRRWSEGISRSRSVSV